MFLIVINPLGLFAPAVTLNPPLVAPPFDIGAQRGDLDFHLRDALFQAIDLALKFSVLFQESIKPAYRNKRGPL